MANNQDVQPSLAHHKGNVFGFRVEKMLARLECVECGKQEVA